MRLKPRAILLFTDRVRKLREWQAIFGRYNIHVYAIPYPTDGDIDREVERRLRDDSSFRVLAVCEEVSNLYKPETLERSPREHLDLVDHVSQVYVRTLHNNTIDFHFFENRTKGYIDRSDGACEEADGWWDSIFRLLDTHQTYSEMRAHTGTKISARDRALSAFLMEHLQREDHADFAFDPIVPERTVDFSVSVVDYVARNTYMNHPLVRASGVGGLLQAALARGTHFRAPRTSRERIQWFPGLHGGTPTVQKTDPVWQSNYLLHDVGGHGLMPDLIFTGNGYDLYRRIYTIWRMLSEACSMVIADMLYVETLRIGGVEYDYHSRRIHTLFRDLKIDLAALDVQGLKVLVAANVEFALTGRTTRYEAMLTAAGSTTEHLKAFTDYYGPMFVKDLEWTDQNWRDMLRRRDEFPVWWQHVQPILRAGGVDLWTIDHVADQLCPHNGDLVDQIFDIAFDHFIAPHYQAPAKPTSAALCTKRGFVRWISGQMMLFARYRFVPELKQDLHLITDYVLRYIDRLDLKTIRRIRAFFEASVERLVRRQLITRDDALLMAEMVPHVEPYFVSYNDEAGSLAELSDVLIGERSHELNPGVVVIITNPQGDRYVFQRKDLNHPNLALRGCTGLFGGSLDRDPHGSYELPQDALERELIEEMRGDEETAREIAHVARYWRHWHLPSVQYETSYDLYVFRAVADNDTLDRWLAALRKNGVVTEGMVTEVSDEELKPMLTDTRNFVCSADVVVRAHIASIAT